MELVPQDTRYSLSGIIELDDTYIGGKNKPGKRGRGAGGKTAVMVAVESRPKGIGHIALFLPNAVSSEQAALFLSQKVKKSASITSDGFSSYQSIAEDFNIDCIALNDPKQASKVLPDVHRAISRLKTWVSGTHTHVSRKHLNQYLSEFSYRFNRRFKGRRETIFDRLITTCCNTKAITYSQLVAGLT